MSQLTSPNLRIKTYLECKQCYDAAKAAKQSPQKYSRLGVGWTGQGIQVFCYRHNLNIALIDFQGKTLPFDTNGVLGAEPQVTPRMLGENSEPECSQCGEISGDTVQHDHGLHKQNKLNKAHT
jgi:hypothetical protein